MKYSFISTSLEGKNAVAMHFDTDSETWAETWAEPMETFFLFLKANGFIFDIDEHIGVMNYSTKTFRAAGDL
jgi:hypothetical protein